MGSSDRDWFGKDDEPPETVKPLTIDESAALYHEIFQAYLRAGFNEAQAMTLLVTIASKYG